MLKNVTDALAGVVKDGNQRLIVLCLAVALTLAGVTRALFEMSVGGVGSFPMPGDNLLMLSVCLVCCLAVSHWHRDVARFARTGAGRVFVTGFSLVCLALLQVCRVPDPALGAQLLFFAGAFVRLAGLLMLVAVYVRVDSHDMVTLAAQVVWALGVSVVLDLVFLLLAPVGVAIVSLVLPLVAWVCLGKLDVTAGISGVADSAASMRHSSSLEYAFDRGKALHGASCAKMPRLRLLTFGLYGAVGGLASSQAHALAPTVMVQPSLLHSCLVNDFGLVLGAGVLIVGTLWLVGRNVDPFALRSLLVPAFLVAIFLAPLLASFMGEVVPVLMALSQALFYGMLWMFPKPASAHERLRWFAAGCGAFFVGTHAGMWLGGDFLPGSGAGDIYMVVAALALAALIMVEFAPRLLGSYDGVTLADTSGTSFDEEGDAPVCPEPAEAALEANAALDALAAHAADAWGLTPRERAVLPGLLRGRSVAWVAENLTVSKNTVHTHMRNIYQKARVHSQEELIDAAEAL